MSNNEYEQQQFHLDLIDINKKMDRMEYLLDEIYSKSSEFHSIGKSLKDSLSLSSKLWAEFNQDRFKTILLKCKNVDDLFRQQA